MASSDANDDTEVGHDESGVSSDEDDTPEVEAALSVGEDDMSTLSMDEALIPDIYDHVNAPSDQDSDDDAPIEPVENEVENGPDDSNIDSNSQDDEDADDDDIWWKQKRPKNTSIAHHILEKNKNVFVSFDIETGGEYCGIIQISAQIMRMTCKDMSDGSDGDWLYKQYKTKKWETTGGPTFNKYVYPGVKAIWNESLTTSVHGLHAEHEEIKRAKLNGQDIGFVWNEFCKWVEDNTQHDEIVTLVAYNGETCDLKWIWRHTQAHNAPGRFPSKMKFFMDPLSVIGDYTSCVLNKKHSNLDSYELGYVWQYINPDTDFPGELHDASTDVQLQCDIIAHSDFAPHINRSSSVKEISDIFSAADRRDMEKQMEPHRNVHRPWKEITPTNNITWQPAERISYTGTSGGPDAGPKSPAKDAARSILVNGGDLSDLYLLMLGYGKEGDYFNVASKQSKLYANEWVVEKMVKDRDGKPKKKPMLQACDKDTPNARRRNANEKKQFEITPAYVMAWHGILILLGGHLGADKGNIRRAWIKPPQGISFPYIKNGMTRDAFEYMKRYLHFANNDLRKKQGEEGYDPLFKVTPALNLIIKGLRKVWSAGQRITIDESMIKYCGRSVTFVQYMPAKPIKHGIKVFCVCCAESGVLLGFEVYCGKENVGLDNTAIAVVERLIEDADLTGQKGRILFTDNWYTSVKLVKRLFEKYRWTFCGTIVPTPKKSRTDSDIPFLKWSNGARNKIERGFFREAVLELEHERTKYVIQCSVWKDRKQVVFVHSDCVGATSNNTVQRHTKKKQTRDSIPAPFSQGRYAEAMDGVDNMDHDCAYYSTSLKTNRWWLRSLFWGHDRVPHAVYQLVLAMARDGIGPPKWKKYINKRDVLQIDLGMDVFNRAIKLAFEELKEGKSRPDFIRQRDFVPCDCEKCYFCKNNYTNGIAHADRMIVEYGDSSSGKRKRNVTDCDAERETIERLSKGQKCIVCMNALKISHPQLNYDGRRKLAKTSTKGCRLCDQPVCEACWAKYEHRNKKRKK